MASSDLESRIREFLGPMLTVPVDRVTPDFDVVNGCGIYGDDVWELVNQFGVVFNVDLGRFRWYHHSGPEGCNPLWLVFRPWWMKKTYIPIRLKDLVESAHRGVWSVEYPEHERELREREV